MEGGPGSPKASISIVSPGPSRKKRCQGVLPTPPESLRIGDWRLDIRREREALKASKALRRRIVASLEWRLLVDERLDMFSSPGYDCSPHEVSDGRLQ